MTNNNRCEAVQVSDQMCCGRCGLAWDVNDPEPPECLTTEQVKAQRIQERKLREGGRR